MSLWIFQPSGSVLSSPFAPVNVPVIFLYGAPAGVDAVDSFIFDNSAGAVEENSGAIEETLGSIILSLLSQLAELLSVPNKSSFPFDSDVRGISDREDLTTSDFQKLKEAQAAEVATLRKEHSEEMRGLYELMVKFSEAKGSAFVLPGEDPPGSYRKPKRGSKRRHSIIGPRRLSEEDAFFLGRDREDILRQHNKSCITRLEVARPRMTQPVA